MGLDLAQLLAVSVFQAFDADSAGRILAGSDESGSMQLAEISPDGSAVTLTALPGPCSGRYLPGERTVVVSHDDGGNERRQLSLLRLPLAAGPARLADLEPLVHDPRYIHLLADVSAGRICYLTNRRDGVKFDVVLRDLATGTEETAFAGDGGIHEAVASPDGRWLAVGVPSALANSDQILLVDLTQPPGPGRDVALHAARKAAKRARYAAEAAIPASGHAARRFAGQMKKVQSALGDHQDTVVGRQESRQLGIAAHLAGESAFTYGLFYERDACLAESLQTRAQKAWQRASRPKYRAWLA